MNHNHNHDHDHDHEEGDDDEGVEIIVLSDEDGNEEEFALVELDQRSQPQLRGADAAG